ncbi:MULTISPECIES: EamA family transporter [Cupriavidus]|jgi:O-acetylserine/cysteine efflux transporter|uniref:EamA family transporter n=1 Tax=Cupriavidus metallidurans TaxID=119219 RepID=A0A2L0XB76_9BURK|nr:MULTISPECIES: EamA family transporter [Cupriavidus]AVA37360.1 EamA family transporter [Cupriavidus metallidurans]KWR84547.1 acetylserine transporter [Cupriavidus sp. SHE]QBP11367.1 EamA family transporter [Cupriavidus metallidurans]QWC88440.1 EamA family transporter [Cupriavidus metallidurans]
MQAKDRLLALAIIVVWGVNFVVIKVGLVGVPPMLLGALRFCLVAFPAVFFIPRPRIPLRMLVAYGATISLGQFVFLFYAMAVGMPAGLASLVLQSQVFFTVAIAGFWLGEPVRWHNIAGMAIAACGLALIGSGAAHGPGGMTLAGFLLTLCAALCWATGNIVSKKIGPVDLLGLVVWGALIPIVPFALLSLWFEGPARMTQALTHISGMGVFAVCYLAFCATLFGYTMWGRLLTRYAASKVAPLTLLVPVVGLISAHLLLGEALALTQWAGALVVMAGLLLNVFGGRLWAGRMLAGR